MAKKSIEKQLEKKDKLIKALRDRLRDRIIERQEILQKNLELNSELESAKRLLWAILKERGQVRISDAIMRLSEDPNIEIEAHYDAKNRATVLGAKPGRIIIFP